MFTELLIPFKEMPRPADAARPTQDNLRTSPALSIQLNGPASFTGRKVGALVTDGVDSAIVRALKTAWEEENRLLSRLGPPDMDNEVDQHESSQ